MRCSTVPLSSIPVGSAASTARRTSGTPRTSCSHQGAPLLRWFHTKFGRIGMLICYDLEIPEWVRMPALDGAQLLCAPVNWPAFPRPDGERPAEVVRVQADAAVNRMFIAACDRTGQERGVDWVGGSVIVDADGWPLAGGTPNGGPLNHRRRVPTRRRTGQGHQPQQQRPRRPASRTVRPPDPDQRSRNHHQPCRVMRLSTLIQVGVGIDGPLAAGTVPRPAASRAVAAYCSRLPQASRRHLKLPCTHPSLQ